MRQKVHDLISMAEAFRRSMNGNRVIQAERVCQHLLNLTPTQAKSAKRKDDLVRAVAMVLSQEYCTKRKFGEQTLASHGWLRHQVVEALAAKFQARFGLKTFSMAGLPVHFPTTVCAEVEECLKRMKEKSTPSNVGQRD